MVLKELSAGIVKGEFIFIEHTAGDTVIDGKPVKWDKVMISDGLSSYKVGNASGVAYPALKRGDSVLCEFRLDRQPKVDKPTLSLVSMTKVA